MQEEIAEFSMFFLLHTLCALEESKQIHTRLHNLVQLFTLLNESPQNWYSFSLCLALAISRGAVSSWHSQNFNTDLEIYFCSYF